MEFELAQILELTLEAFGFQWTFGSLEAFESQLTLETFESQLTLEAFESQPTLAASGSPLALEQNFGYYYYYYSYP